MREAVLVDENRSLGNREGRARTDGGNSINVSQKNCYEMYIINGREYLGMMVKLYNAEKRLRQSLIAAAVFVIYRKGLW